jgi:CubicO group peptidase (beta-lactamase class C family)
VAKTRLEIWLALIVLAVGVGLAAVVGLFSYIAMTSTPLHPDATRVPSVARSTPSSQWADAVEQGRQIVRAGVAGQNLPGVAVAVGAGGDILWAEGFGWADLENRVAVTPETRFRIGNVSNTLTSAAVGLLLEKKKLNLDEQIQTYVPEFPEKQWPVTLGQLMGHVAGVRNDEGDEEPLSEHCERTVDGLRRFAKRRLLFEPGTQYRSSSYGWILVSAAVEDAADERFFTFMRTQVFEPLGMAATRPDSAAEPIADRATFYFPRFAGDTRYGPELARDGDHLCLAGAGAFLSTPSDLVRFGMAFNGGKLLQPATVNMLQTPQWLISGQQTNYGLGWQLQTVPLAGEPTRMAGHGTKKDFIGGTASLITFPERGIVVAVTSNISFADTHSIGLSIAQAFATPARLKKSTTDLSSVPPSAPAASKTRLTRSSS